MPRRNGRNAGRQRLSRREFLRNSSAALAAMLLSHSCQNPNEPTPPPPVQARPPRPRKPNAFVNHAGLPLLVCVSGNDFAAMLTAGLTALGGLDRLIAPTQDVLIKPNCNASEPYPAVSSLSSLLAILQEVKKVSSGTVRVADQGYQSSASVYSYMGLDPAIGNAGGALLTLAETYRVRRSAWPDGKPDFHVYADIYDAPVLINSCVLKRHNWAGYSCAIKNNVGAVAGPGAGSTRNYLHNNSPDLMADVAEIAGLVNPELNIVDARSMLTRGGPFYEDGTVVDAHKIVLCGDIVATDAYCIRILSAHDPTFQTGVAAPTLSQAEILGMGTADLSHVQVIEISV